MAPAGITAAERIEQASQERLAGRWALAAAALAPLPHDSARDSADLAVARVRLLPSAPGDLLRRICDVEEAMGVYRQLGDTAAFLVAVGIAAHLHLRRGDPVMSLDRARRLVQAAEQAEDGHAMLAGLLHAALALEWMGDLVTAESVLQDAARGRDAGFGASSHLLLVDARRARLAFRRGLARTAREWAVELPAEGPVEVVATRALLLGEEAGVTVALDWPALVVSEEMAGDPALALIVAERLSRTSEVTLGLPPGAAAATVPAELAPLLRLPAAREAIARGRWTEAAALLEAPGALDWVAAVLAPLRAEVWIQQGRLGPCLEEIGRHLENLGRNGFNAEVAVLAVTRARVLRLLRRGDEALSTLAFAAEAAQRAEIDAIRGLVDLEYGASLLHSGAFDEARARLEGLIGSGWEVAARTLLAEGLHRAGEPAEALAVLPEVAADGRVIDGSIRNFRAELLNALLRAGQ